MSKVYHIVLKEIVLNIYTVEADSLKHAIENAMTRENILDNCYTIGRIKQEFYKCENLETVNKESKKYELKTKKIRY